MLNKRNRFIFICQLLTISCALILSGCFSEYNIVTEKEELIFYDTDREIGVGKSIAKGIENKYKILDDPLLQERVKDIGKKLVDVSDRKDLEYQFKVIDEKEVNAFALPGGFIYVNKGLLDDVKENDDEIACVLAHEIAHVVAKHSIKKLQAVMGYSILRIAIASTPAAEVSRGADFAFYQIMIGYSREDEALADRLAARYTKEAGYNPEAMITFLERLRKNEFKKPPRGRIDYSRTHPYIGDRIRAVKQEIGQPLTFKDFLNKGLDTQ